MVVVVLVEDVVGQSPRVISSSLVAAPAMQVPSLPPVLSALLHPHAPVQSAPHVMLPQRSIVVVVVVLVDVDDNDVDVDVDVDVEVSAPGPEDPEPWDDALEDPDDSVVPLEPAEPDDPDPDPDVSVPDAPDDPLDDPDDSVVPEAELLPEPEAVPEDPELPDATSTAVVDEVLDDVVVDEDGA